MTAPSAEGWEQALRTVVDSAVDSAAEQGRRLLGSSGLVDVLAGVRDRRPDLLEGLADVLASTAEVLRAQATAGQPTPSGGGEADPDHPTTSATTPAEETVSQPAPTPVQRIDVA